MSTGKVHLQVSLTAAIPLAAVSILATVYTNNPAMLGLALGAFTGCISTPDNDHEWTTESELTVYRFSKTLGALWELFWKPYELMHVHRGTSHTYPKGTIVRFLYLFWLPIALSVGWELWPVFWLLVFVGESVPDLLHLWYDELM